MGYAQTLKKLIYRVKFRFPTPIVLINIGASTTDYDTGGVSLSETRFTVKRAVSLPEALSAFTQSGGLFRLSGSITESVRPILIDKADAKGMDISVDNTKVLLDNKRWDVSKVLDHENVIYEIWLKDIEGSPL